MPPERNESARPGGAGAVRPDSLGREGLTAVLANGRLRRRRAAAGFVSAVAVVALASACGGSSPVLPGWAGNLAPPLLAGHGHAGTAAVGLAVEPAPAPQSPLTAASGAAASSPAPVGDRPLTPPPLSISAGSTVAPDGAAAAGPVDPTPSSATWAVVIGINRYPGGGAYDLESAVNDANDMAMALQEMSVPADHVLVLHDGMATANGILAATNWLVDHAGPGTTAVFFYAGHTEKLSPSTEAMIAADGGQITNGELADRFSGLEASRAWFVIAACFGGGFDNLLAPGRIVTAAADANHLAYENETFHRSYLVQYMIRQAMIEGRAPGSVQNAFAYAVSAIHHDYPGREPVEADDLGSPLDVGPAGAVPNQSPPAGPATPTPPSTAPETPNAPSPPGPPSSPGTSTPPATDACSSLTFGVVRCSG